MIMQCSSLLNSIYEYLIILHSILPSPLQVTSTSGYCHNLCEAIITKLFLDHKTLYYCPFTQLLLHTPSPHPIITPSPPTPHPITTHSTPHHY